MPKTAVSRLRTPLVLIFWASTLCCAGGSHLERPGRPGAAPDLLPLRNASVVKLRFFESGYNAAPMGKRIYRSRFPRDYTRYIYWELHLAFPPQKRQVEFDIDGTWYRPDGSIFARHTRKCRVKPHWTRFRRRGGWGSKSGSWWLPGSYRVDLSVAGKTFASGTFEVTGPSPAPSKAPILRLDTGMHTASLWEVDVDADERFMVTCSNDKTVRVWDLAGRRLIRTLRPPIENGKEGRISAVALSPDGLTVACGGRTGYAWDRSCSVLLFDRATGRLLRRITGFPGRITSMVYSREGRFLAVGFHKGLRVFRTPSLNPLGADEAYEGRCNAVDFGRGNRLATGSLDGVMRLYEVSESGLRLTRKAKTPSGPHPYALDFSPDGTKIAVGYWASSGYWASAEPRVDVLSGEDLSFLFAPDTAGLQHGLEPVAWSADGRTLYAGGYPMTWEGKRLAPVVRWNEGGRGEKRVLCADTDAIQDICPLQDGRVVFGAFNTAWGVIDRHGERVFYQPPAKADFRGYMNIPRDRLKAYLEGSSTGGDRKVSSDGGWLAQPRMRGFPISEDAARVVYSYEAKGRAPALFDLEQRTVHMDPAREDSFLMPVLEAPGLKITDWCGRADPKLNGKALRLGKNEIAWSLAIAPDRRGFLLGTEWNLYRFDKKGQRVWRIPLHSPAWAVNISKDSGLAVLAMADGTVRWYRMEDGREILAFFPHADRKRWIAWTPDGYYMASPLGDELIGWHLNNGKDREADFYSAVQFERILYRPAYVLAYFRHRGDRDKASRALGGRAFDVGDLRSIAPPKVEILSPQTSRRTSSKTIPLRVLAQKRRLPMQSFTVFVNGIPVTPSSKRSLSGRERDSFTRALDLQPLGRENRIRVEVFNGTSMGLAEAFVHCDGLESGRQPGDLYLFAVGIDDFANMPAGDLSYAATDAVNVAGAFQRQEGKAFRRVHARVLSDLSKTKPSKRQILEHLEFVKQAGANDTVIVYLASHGLSDPAGNYFFVPADAQIEDVGRIVEACQRGPAGPVVRTPSLIRWETFFNALRATPGRRILIVDTCQARNISGTLDVHTLAKRSVTSSFALLAASQGNEHSQEYPEGGQGLFTYALLKGLAGDGDRNRDGRVVLTELYDFIRAFVENKRNREIGKQTPNLASPSGLEETPLAFP